ncbi:Cornifin domain-containing protein [Rhizoctonia solani AG-1 IA]|uniref:Cornifin domain-containing protein n=1 Tax=Thanatephorus cucumeris (strain AG1-IA) TaxID=983506 RepID=L8X0D3_THACA|nr:Cornifin domain-containing protein [Rhizoctonia solani AG-1 IA]
MLSCQPIRERAARCVPESGCFALGRPCWSVFVTRRPNTLVGKVRYKEPCILLVPLQDETSQPEPHRTTAPSSIMRTGGGNGKCKSVPEIESHDLNSRE